MEQHQLFYMFVTLLVSIFTLGLTVVVYRKTKAPLVQSYLALHLTFGLGVLGQFLKVYRVTSQFPIHLYFDEINAYIQGFIVPFLVIITLPRFIHQLFVIPHAKRYNTVFFGMAIFTYSFGQFFEFAVKDEKLCHLHPGGTSVVVFLVFVYSVIWGFRYLPTIQEEPRKLLAKKVLILLGVTIPVMWLDVFKIVLPPLHPLVYMAMCVLVSHHFMRYDLPHVQVIPPVNKEEASVVPESEVPAAEASERSLTSLLTDELFQQYNISPREQELVPLLLQGYGNQQIGETLFISLSTVKTHLRSIYSKFGVKNRYELIAFLQNLKTQKS